MASVMMMLSDVSWVISLSVIFVFAIMEHKKIKKWWLNGKSGNSDERSSLLVLMSLSKWMDFYKEWNWGIVISPTLSRNFGIFERAKVMKIRFWMSLEDIPFLYNKFLYNK